MRGVLPLAVELWTFGSPERLPTSNFSKCWASPPHLAKVGLRHSRPSLGYFIHISNILINILIFLSNIIIKSYLTLPLVKVGPCCYPSIVITRWPPAKWSPRSYHLHMRVLGTTFVLCKYVRTLPSTFCVHALGYILAKPIYMLGRMYMHFPLT
jgi:hypothetical protein